jgi:hypothetical protein
MAKSKRLPLVHAGEEFREDFIKRRRPAASRARGLNVLARRTLSLGTGSFTVTSLGTGSDASHLTITDSLSNVNAALVLFFPAMPLASP